MINPEVTRPEVLSPSNILFNLLLADIRPTQVDLDALATTQHVSLDRIDGIALIRRVVGNTVYYSPFNEMGRKNGLPHFVVDKKHHVATARYLDVWGKALTYIREDDPNLIGVALNRGEIDWDVSFTPEDPQLDKIIEPALKDFPSINTPKDLEELTLWVHNALPYKDFKFESGEKKEMYHPIGAVIAKRGVTCRQLTAVEYAILKLKGVAAQPVVAWTRTEMGEKKSGHMFLEVELPNERLHLADPTSGLAGTQMELTLMCALNQETELRRLYQLPVNRMALVGKWLPKAA